MLCDVVEPSKV